MKTIPVVQLSQSGFKYIVCNSGFYDDRCQVLTPYDTYFLLWDDEANQSIMTDINQISITHVILKKPDDLENLQNSTNLSRQFLLHFIKTLSNNDKCTGIWLQVFNYWYEYCCKYYT